MIARFLFVGLLTLLIGCGKPSSPAPATPPEVESAAEPRADDTDDAQIAAALGDLTQVVRKFSVEQRRAPTSLEELVANGYLSQVPQAPVGKRFAINKNLQVYLTE
jgi:hypothetical protein